MISIPAPCVHVLRHPQSKSGHLFAQSNDASCRNSANSLSFMLRIRSMFFTSIFLSKITILNNCRYWLPALALAQSTAPAAVQLWHGAPVAFSARYQLTLFFIVYLVFAPEIFLQGPSFVLAPYSRCASYRFTILTLGYQKHFPSPQSAYFRHLRFHSHFVFP